MPASAGIKNRAQPRSGHGGAMKENMDNASREEPAPAPLAQAASHRFISPEKKFEFRHNSSQSHVFAYYGKVFVFLNLN